MHWSQEFLPEALEDIRKLDGSTRSRVIRAIDKVAQNPLPQSEGGYGKPLGNRHGYDLAGLLKIKLKKDGVRIVYKLERSADVMKVVIVGVRGDMEAYRKASQRRKTHEL